MSLRYSNKTWPFKWSASIKYIRNKLDIGIDLTPGSNAPVALTKLEHEKLMSTLPKDFIKTGEPVYRGRDIKNTGNK